MIYKCILTDLDGTVYLDSNPIGQIVKNINIYKSRKGKIYFITNNTSVTKTEYLKKLLDLGLERVCIDDIITPIDVFLKQIAYNKIKSCFYLLPDEVIKYVIKCGGPKYNDTSPDAVIVGFDKQLTYNKLQKASLLISNNTPYYLTHNDYFCPTASGPIPDAGSIASLLFKATGLKHEADFGKPSYLMADYVRILIDSLDINLSDVIMIGDRRNTDIMLGKEIAIKTCLVLTGDKSQNSNNINPDYECQDINYFFENYLY